MLASIRVKNFALVEDTELQLDQGLTVFTGETGAGKSLLLNAILLLLGNRASASWVRKGALKAEVEGQFVLGSDPERLAKLAEMGFELEDPTDCLVVRREFGSSENVASRIWIQGKAATRAQLQSALGDLIEVSGQHEFLRLNKSSYVLDILDSLSDHPEDLLLYKDVFQKYEALQNDLLRLNELKFSEDSLDYLKSQIEELKDLVNFTSLAELEEELEKKAKQLSSRDKFLEQLQSCLALIEGAGENSFGLSDLVRSLDKEFRKLCTLIGNDDLLQRIDDLNDVLSELEEEVEALHVKWSDESLQSEEVLETLSRLRRAKRKYQVQSALELKEIYDQKTSELKTLEEADLRKNYLEKQIKNLKIELEHKAQKISLERKKISEKLISRWEKSVRELGMPHATFSLRFERSSLLSLKGVDEIELYFSSNRGHELMPLSKVASGGELSRILLSLKECVAQKVSVGVYLFDEVDTGIGGETAHIVGKKLARLAASSQVLVVTHLAQIAAFANEQVRVEKTDDSQSSTKSVLKVLSKSERLEELARMLGGQKMSSARKLAEDMVKRVRQELSSH